MKAEGVSRLTMYEDRIKGLKWAQKSMDIDIVYMLVAVLPDTLDRRALVASWRAWGQVANLTE